ncbi:hypothetical protein N0V83_010821 [Neocucurbitaria cava]|uniref:AB hydrolase-1 domain-containing protein n=1 Tax=Neocucurbitaria cava TaxID=798079 RepID=A0A9W8XYV3_9PLEO|nr:hypothetical protein N0V83_010821 [Neocucurbitaria cava]
MAPLTADELVKHPEYNHTIWPLEPEKKGKVQVAKDRGGPIDIAYEVHGHGDRHLVWVMGLGGMMYAWQRQTKDFGHTKGDQYSSLVFDNRGIGDSSKPRFRYSTSEMAKDVVELVDHIGWTGKRELHLIGISMGGMIAQELAMLIPERICTLSLVSTAAGLFRTTGFLENLWNRANLFIPKSLDTQIAAVKANLYTPLWLSSPDTLPAVSSTPFPTNGDRFAANELWKRQHPQYFGKPGFILQAIAAGWHHKSAQQLQEIAEKGVTGRENWLGVEEEEDVWAEGLVEKHFVKGQGHVLPAEMREEFMGWQEGLIERGVRLNAGEEGV